MSFVIYSLLLYLYVSRDFRGMEAFLRSPRVYPRLTNGNVLGVGRAPHLRPDVGVDPSQVFPVQVFEGRPVGEHGRFMVGARTIFEPTPGQAAL